MPTNTGEHKRRIGFRIELGFRLLVGGKIDAALQRIAGVVELVDVIGQLRGSVTGRRRQQLDRQLSLAETAGRVEPRCNVEGNALGIQAGYLIQLR